MFRNILVPTDGSPLSRKAIKQAVRLAKEQGARITGLHVVPPYAPDVHEDIALRNFVSPREYARRSAAAARVHLQVIERAARAAGVPCQTLHAARCSRAVCSVRPKRSRDSTIRTSSVSSAAVFFLGART